MIEFAQDWIEENAMSTQGESLPTPELMTLVTEVNVLSRQLVQNYLAIGQRLAQIKAIVGHGNFGAYIKENCGYSQDVAQKMMRIAAEYSECSVPVKLGVSKLYELLALPAEEREIFVRDHDVESATVRELREQIAQEKKRAETAESLRDWAENRRKDLVDQNEKLRQEAKVQAENAANSSRAAEQYSIRLNAAAQENDRLRDEMSRRPAVDEEAAIALATAAAERREREIALQYESRLAEAQSRQLQAEGELEQLRAQLDEGGQAPSAVSMSGIVVLISSMVNDLNGLRDVLSEGAWNSEGSVEQEWLELAHLELSKVGGVLKSAQDAIVRNYPEEDANDD